MKHTQNNFRAVSTPKNAAKGTPVFYKKNQHYSLDAERAVLGELFLNPNAYELIYKLDLKADHFYSPVYAEIFQAIADMDFRDVGLITVNTTLAGKGIEMMENEEGVMMPLFDHIQVILSTIHSTHLFQRHAVIVKDYFVKRVGYTALVRAGDLGTDTFDRAKETQELINSALEVRVDDDWMDASQVMMALQQHREDVKNKKKKGVSTGFYTLDNWTGGMQSTQVWLLGARPSVGKTALAATLLVNIAGQGKAVGIISLEMPTEQMAGRLSSIYSGIDFWRVYRNVHSSAEEEATLEQAIANMGGMPFQVSTKTRVNSDDIRYKTIKLIQKVGHENFGCLIIDYLQLIETETKGKNETREREVSKLSRDLKVMAMELNIPVLVLGQLNRESDKAGTDKKPRMSNLRESGSLEQDADVVMLLHRDYKAGVTAPDGESNEGKAELIVEKVRNGETGIIPLEFHPGTMRFYEPDGSDAFDRPMPNPQQREEPAAAYNAKPVEYLQQPQNPYGGMQHVRDITQDDDGQPF